jgi:tetratricopeptide (TPR) repeat protein
MSRCERQLSGRFLSAEILIKLAQLCSNMNTSLPESSCWTRFGTEAAKARYEEGTEIERQIGGKFLLGSELAHLSDVLRLEGDLAGAIKLAEESLAISREAQNKRGTARSLHSLASAAAQRGDIAGARKMYAEALAMRNELGYKGHRGGKLSLCRGEQPRYESRISTSARCKSSIRTIVKSRRDSGLDTPCSDG